MFDEITYPYPNFNGAAIVVGEWIINFITCFIGNVIKKTWTGVIGMDCLAQGLAETHLSARKAWSGRLRSVVKLGPPLY